MFVRSELKQQAKDLMKDHFPQMFLVTLIAGLFTGDLINVDFKFDTEMIQVNLAQNYSFTLTHFIKKRVAYGRYFQARKMNISLQ